MHFVLRSWFLVLSTLALACGFARDARAADFTFRMQEIATDLKVGYATVVVDMNDDQRPDIVVVDTMRVVWYENPSWKVHTLIQDQTKKDNVCIAPYDVDN